MDEQNKLNAADPSLSADVAMQPPETITPAPNDDATASVLPPTPTEVVPDLTQPTPSVAPAPDINTAMPEVQAYQPPTVVPGVDVAQTPPDVLPNEPFVPPQPSVPQEIAQSTPPPQAFSAQDVSTPAGPQLAAAPVVPAPMPFANAPAMAVPVAGSKKFPIKLVVALLVVLAVVGGGAFAAMKFLGGIKLEKFENDNYSILIPVDYEQETGPSGSVQFSEKKADGKDRDSLSGVNVLRREIPSTTTDEIKEKAFTNLETSYKDKETYKGVTSKSSDVAENIEVKRDKFLDYDAVIASATIMRDGKEFSHVKVITFIEGGEFYNLSILGNISDPGVIKAMDKILNSFVDK